jgi:hypothetical protein
MRRQTLTGKFPTERPPDPENGNPGAVGTATGAEIQRSVLQRTTPRYRKSHACVQSVPLTNFKGWSDLNSRAAMMQRFAEHERQGRRCVALPCGDHDPGGLPSRTISTRTSLT